MTDEEPRVPEGDETRQMIQRLRGDLANKTKGAVYFRRDVEGVGTLHYSVRVVVTGGNIDLDLEARGLTLHEAVEQMEILVGAIL